MVNALNIFEPVADSILLNTAKTPLAITMLALVITVIISGIMAAKVIKANKKDD